MDDPLTWDDSYAIARELIRQHPDVKLEEVTLDSVYRWTLQLPQFDDDPLLLNDAILMAIYREWFEEANKL